MRVSSSTSNESGAQRGLRTVVPLGSIALAIVLSLLLGAITPASADGLKDARDRVHKQVIAAKKQVAEDESVLSKAEAKLRASQTALATARADLSTAEDQLAQARAVDADLLTQLRAAQAAVKAAQTAEQVAQQKVDDQRSVIGSVAREAYENQSNLTGLAILLGAESPRDLASRDQWNQTVFDSTTTEFNRLSQLEAEAQAARQTRQASEAAVADKRKQSAANVAKTKALADAADASRAKVAALVATNQKLQQEAAAELEASKKQYDKVQKQEAKIAAQIRGDGGDYSNPNGFIKPVNASAGSPFGMRFHPILHYWRMHWGTDFGAACGMPIRAMANGKVVSAGWTTYGFGNYTIISYGRMFGANLSSGYAHQSKVIVKAGQHVKQGQIVGYVGTTGLSTGCHLHLQIYRNGVRVNPMRYL